MQLLMTGLLANFYNLSDRWVEVNASFSPVFLTPEVKRNPRSKAEGAEAKRRGARVRSLLEGPGENRAAEVGADEKPIFIILNSVLKLCITYTHIANVYMRCKMERVLP